MIPAIISLLVLLGAGGTVVASDGAKPGDILFPIDRASEKVQLAVSNAEKKIKLKTKFANERLNEVEALILEANEEESDTATSTSTTATSTSATSTDQTATTTATSTDDEDGKKTNIEEGFALAIELISGLENSEEYTALISKLNTLITEVPENTNIQVKVSDQGAQFLKVRSEDDSNKLEIEVKETGGGMILIKSRNEDGKLEVEKENGKSKIKWEVKSNLENKGKSSDDDDDDTDNSTSTVKSEDDDDDDKDDDRNDKKQNSKDDDDKDTDTEDGEDDDEEDDTATSTDDNQ